MRDITGCGFFAVHILLCYALRSPESAITHAPGACCFLGKIIDALSAGVFYEIAAGHFCRLGKAHEVKERRGDVSEYTAFSERYAAA